MADIQKLLEDEDKVYNLIKDIFNEIDTDGSGDIDREEMKELMQSFADELGQEVSDEQIDKQIDELDTDGDGAIQLDEFAPLVMEMLKKMAGEL